MSLQDSKIMSLVLRHAAKDEIIPMLTALRNNGVTYTQEDYRLICRRGSLSLFDFVLETEDINKVLEVGGFTGTSETELKYFEAKGASLALLDRLFSYNSLYRDAIEFFLIRGYKHQEEFERILSNLDDTSRLEHLVSLGGIPNDQLLERYYNTYLLTCFPPHDNELLQLRAIARDDVAVISNLDLVHTHYSYTLIEDEEFYKFEQDSPLFYQQTFTALDCALLFKSNNVAKLLIEQNADITINVFDNDMKELLFYNYPNLGINLSFDINRAKELWNPINREKMQTLTLLRSEQDTPLKDVPNELLFLISYFM